MPIEIDVRPTNLKIELLLSVQRALLDEIDPNLRSVQIDWDDENEIIYIFFYFDGIISSENTNSASCIAGEVAGDFLPTVKIIEKMHSFRCSARTPFSYTNCLSKKGTCSKRLTTTPPPRRMRVDLRSILNDCGA